MILFNKVQVPHYNYVGDSILGYKAHMGAGSITSNVKSDKTLVVVKDGEKQIATGLKKFGAMLGDHVEVGCNSVLNPGTSTLHFGNLGEIRRKMGPYENCGGRGCAAACGNRTCKEALRG